MPTGNTRSAPDVGWLDCAGAAPLAADPEGRVELWEAPDDVDGAALLSVDTALEAELTADDEAAAAAVM